MDQYWVIQVFHWLSRMSLLDKRRVYWLCALRRCLSNEWRGKSWPMHLSSGSVFSSSNCPCSDAKHLLTASSLILPMTLKLVFKFTHKNKDSGPHSCWMVQSDFELDPWILYLHPLLCSSIYRGKGETWTSHITTKGVTVLASRSVEQRGRS